MAYNLFRIAAILQGIAKRVVDGTAASRPRPRLERVAPCPHGLEVRLRSGDAELPARQHSPNHTHPATQPT